MMNSLSVAVAVSSHSSEEVRAEGPLDSDISTIGTATRHPSASLAIEATEADEFLALERESAQRDADFGDFSDEAGSGTSGLCTQDVPQPALLAQVPKSGDPPEPEVIP